MKNGYKQTEIGFIPEDWNCAAAKYLMRIETGSRNTEHKTDAGKYPFFVRSQKIEHIDTYHYDCEAVLTAGDGVGTGKVFHHYIGKFDAHQRVYVMSDFKGITGRFFYNYFSENFGNEVSKYTAKSSVDSVRRDMIAEMLIPTPPIPEQERIAEALSDVDSMISSLEKLIEKKKAVKQGAMQELLTGKKRLPGFDGEWKSILLEDVCVFYNGGTPSKKRSDWWNGCIPWISSSDLCENSITSVSINRYITQDALDHSATRLCPKNAVSIVSRVGVGKVAVTPCELCTSQDFTTIVSSAHNPYFLAYMLVPIMKDMAMQAQGTSIKGVTVEDIAKIKISTPSIKEQNQIVSILSDMDNEIETLEQKLAKTRQVKQGMMQQLLTGKIRLV